MLRFGIESAKTLPEANIRKQQFLEKPCPCPDDQEPQIFSVHFWSDGRPFDAGPDGLVDMETWIEDPSRWYRPADPPRYPDGGVNFDFAYQDENNRWWHADHLHDPDGEYGSMTVYESSLDKWQESNWDFDKEVFCVACKHKEP